MGIHNISTTRKAHAIKLGLTLFIVSFSLGMVALAVKTFSRPPVAKANPPLQTLRSSNGKRPEARGIVRRAQLLPSLRDALGVLGNRLTAPGKERVVLTGVLTRSDDSASRPFVAIQELPGRVRFEVNGHSPLAAVFDGNKAWKPGGNPNRVEQDILEALASDSAERLFIANASGVSTRFLGSRFSLTTQAAGAGESVYDVYQLTEPVTIRGEIQTRTKTFFVNSDTLLLERVRYQISRDGTQSDVEVRLSEWRDILGQKVPFSITRTETGGSTISLTINFVSVGPELKDGTFTKPSAN